MRSLGVRTRFSLLFLAALALLFGVTAVVLVVQDRDRLRETFRERTLAIAGTVLSTTRVESSEAPLSVGGQQRLCEALVNVDNVLWVEIFDGAGKVAAHSNRERVGRPPLPTHAAHVAGILRGGPAVEEWNDDEQRFGYFVPIAWEVAGGENPQAVIEIVMDTSGIAREVEANFLRILALFLILGAITFAVLSLGLRRILVGEVARQEAEATADYLGGIVQDSKNEVYVFDAESLRFRFVNNGALENLGYSLDEMRQMTPYAIKPEHTRASFEKLVAPLREDDTDRIRFVTVHRRKDGTEYPVEVFLGSVTRGDSTPLVAIVLDITERQRAERALRRHHRLQAVGQLAAGIAHDFNNFLAPIIGYTGLVLKRMPEDSAEAEQLAEVVKAARRARELVEQIMTFSRQGEEESGSSDLVRVVDEVTGFLGASLPARVEMKSHVVPERSLVSLGTTQAHRLVTNLCINAIQAIGESEGLLSIELDEIDIAPGGELAATGLGRGRHARLTVTDTGVGMDEDTLDRMFEPFFTTKNVGEGTGMGLSLVIGIVQSAGGEVTASSTPGKGTTLQVLLPTCTMEPKCKAPSEDLDPRGAERVLLVDDDAVVADVSSRMLEEYGYTLSTQTSSEEALALFTASPDAFDIVVTDQTMPSLSGLQLAAQLQAVKPGVSIVLMTGYSEDVTAETIHKHGIGGFVMKPVVAVELAQAIRRVLDTPTEQGAHDGDNLAH